MRSTAPPTGARGGGAQWYGILAPPIAMLLNVNLGYALVVWSCASGTRSILYLELAVLVLIALSGGFVGHREWSKHGGGGDSDDAGGPAARIRFLGLLGIGSSAMFTLILIWQWIANAFLTPCLST